ncbi:hypothetical protein BDB01DRAFT_848001 [Pilobolus umbonatus]|nr:hypothetical protein BDB01DRAFT_848001 [Pilobolus umbonatus]
MGRKRSKKEATVDDTSVEKKLVDTSEIDDIFNKKIKTVHEEKNPEIEEKRLKKKKKKQKDEKEAGEEKEEAVEEENTKEVEEVVFAELAAVKSAKKSQNATTPLPPVNDGFGDSRGLKKTNRTTDDGYPLYDVKDLNIGNGLDTPLCPFDCDCCKYSI